MGRRPSNRTVHTDLRGVIGPAFDRYRITLRLREPARFHFVHGGVVMGLLSRALECHPLPDGVIPFACESGAVHFSPGDSYAIGVTLAGGATALAGALERGLKQVGARSLDSAAVLGGNYDLAAFERLPEPDLDGEAERIASRGALTLRFLSPLRLHRPAHLQAKGAGYVNGDCFPAGHFLERLLRRIMFLDLGEDPPEADRARLAPAVGEAATEALDLVWLDVPLTAEKRTRARGYTLGGVQGAWRLRYGDPGWLPWLVAGQYLHAGESTHYGFGCYRIAETAHDDREIAPARTARQALADEAALHAALDHILKKSEAGGLDGITPEDFASERARLVPELVADLRRGEYRPAALKGIAHRKEGGRLRPLVVPTVRDRLVQRVASACWGPAIEELLEDCSYAYGRGSPAPGRPAPSRRRTRRVTGTCWMPT